MLIQLSSGQGPAECEFAVGGLFLALKTEYPDIEMISSHSSRFSGCYTSILFSTEEDLSDLEGSIQWICKSPFRPNHKRKNWFIDVSIIPEAGTVCRDEDIRFDRFHCGGNGGQNVNKVETGVRLTHIPTGITVTATSERSQLMNRKIAKRKLEQLLTERELAEQKKQTHSAWREHTRIVRGNPVRIYTGMGFKLKKN